MWGITLQRQHEISLTRQIYQALQEQMLTGRLSAGEALPSTRELAKQLGVSRNTVCEAYEMLAAEGFIESRQGAATRVAAGLLLEQAAPADQGEAAELLSGTPIRADFRTGHPDLRRFPHHLWRRLLHQAAATAPLEQWGYSGPEGLLPLREEIAAWLLRSRGLSVSPQQVFITAGATQALHLLTEVLELAGREVLVEDPCHAGMLQVLQGKGCRLHPVPVDEQGMRTECLEARGAGAIYVTPSHQFPLGGILPAGRRTALVRFAREQDLFVIEDDYDSEFRYAGPPVAPLRALDPERVIYVGTFSKILFPALRIGYVILPTALHQVWRQARQYLDVQNPPFAQLALAELLRTRKLDRHVRRMRKVYGQRRQTLLTALKDTFPSQWTPWGDLAGLHLALEFPGRRFDQDFARQAREWGIRLTPVDTHSIRKGAHLDKVLLGYGHLESAEIQAGVALLHQCMQAVKP